MAKFKVKHSYQDYDKNKYLKKNSEVEMTVKRSEEVNEKLKSLGTVLERIDK
ncbi:hypothetical protein ABDK10_02450 [Staphylococcus aureus]